MTAPPTPTISHARSLAVLGVIGLALMTVVSAVSGLNVALPTLAREMGASQTDLTWIVDAYTIAFAGLLLFAGALGDRYGRKLVLAVGLGIFGTAAALAMVFTEPGQLIALRAAMGVGAAAIMPTTLSVITTSFPVEERPRAIGVWVGLAGGGAVIGLFGSAFLLEVFSAWQSFFALNVALAVISLIGVIAIVPGSVDERPPALDWIGGFLSLVAVGGTIFGIIEGPERGWTDPVTVTALVAGIGSVIAFVVWELRRREPMLDPRLFANRALSAGTLTITVQFFAAFGFFFIMLQYLQFITDRSPLEAAVALLPLPFILLPIARTAPLVAARIGFRRVAPVGLLFMAAGFGVLSFLEADSSYLFFLAGMVLFGIGLGLAGTPSTTAITEALPPSKQGVASALNDTAREVGSAFGIAILGSVLNQAYRDNMVGVVTALPAQIADRVLASVAFVAAPEIQEAGPAVEPIVAAARDAFVVGVGDAVLVASIVLAVAAVVVFVLAPAPAKRRETVSPVPNPAQLG